MGLFKIIRRYLCRKENEDIKQVLEETIKLNGELLMAMEQKNIEIKHLERRIFLCD